MGHLKKRSEGSWTVWYEVPRGPDGKRRQRTMTVKGNKAKALEALRKVEGVVANGRYIDPLKTTLAEYVEDWLTSYADVHLRKNTVNRYRMLATRINATLGRELFAKLAPYQVQGLWTQLTREKLSAQTILHHHRFLHRVLAHAEMMELIERNPLDRVKPPRPPQKAKRVLDVEEVKRLMEAGRKSWAYEAIALAITTGMRRSEIMALRWQDVDLDTATLRVSHSLDGLIGGTRTPLLSEPKTARSARLVELPAPMVAILRDMAANYLPGTSPYLFPGKGGEVRHPDHLTRAFQHTAKRAGLDGLRLHDCRHTHASLLLSWGVPVATVAERLGHSSPRTTLAVYAHSIRGAQRLAADQFGDAVSNRLAKPPKS